MLFQRTGGVDFLIVGLGNPGMAYENTRHNAGYGALQALAKELHTELSKKQCKALTGMGEIEGKRVLLLFPQTFMNLSGESVQAALHFYKLTPEQLLVFSDDVALPLGAVRVRRSGSDGGQKGLRSIIGCIGTDAFPRVRIGVGAKPHPAYDMADWVLSRFKPEEQRAMDEAYEKAAGAAQLIVAGHIDQAMNRYSH